MNSHYVAPHKGGPVAVHQATNAALLIDFDNVTMGIRSDLTKELKNLLNSSIIKGKVAVQRAYADWRRYPQYIVPLSEGSVDLIFAPAYGSSKKNATDIRLAIDALELVFTRPEIGTFILLSGDSDFSSLVLKLKEYGKYVIGVGIKESSSDLLVQNCDEYYSYNALTGLQRAGEDDTGTRMDPWDLVQAAVERMAENDDVMRSDRLKQVMIEMDDGFDEKAVGYSKYNRFLSEAATKGRIKLRKLENGQYEVAPVEGRRRAEPARTTGGRGPAPSATVGGPAIGGAVTTGGALTLDAAYDLLRRAVRDLAGSAGGAVRDSDVKRRMLELRPDWDETAVGFSKFSHFLRQAHNSEIIDLQRTGEGLYEVVLPSGAPVAPLEEAEADDARSARMERGAGGRGESERESPARGGNGRSRGGRGRGGRDRAEGEEREPRSRGGRGRGRGRDAVELPPSEPHLSGAEATGSRPALEERPPQPRTERPSRTRAESADRSASLPAEEPLPREQAQERSTPAAAPSMAAPAPPATQGAAPSGLGRGRRGPRRGASEGPPPLLPGQTIELGSPRATSAPVTPPSVSDVPARPESSERAAAKQVGPMPMLAGVLDPRELGLPTEAGAVTRYLTNRYRGVGDKTAEQLVETFGAEHVFAALQAAPERVSELVGAHRAAALLDAWKQDYARRSGAETEVDTGSERVPSSVGTEPAPSILDGAAPASREAAAPHLDEDDDDEPRYAATPGYEHPTPGPVERPAAADVERETMPTGVERELPPAADEREVLASDVEREAPDLWTRPRETQGE